MIIYLAILAVLCFIGINDSESNKKIIAYVIMFIICIAAIILLKIY